jgi:uncharacterized membrane protein
VVIIIMVIVVMVMVMVMVIVGVDIDRYRYNFVASGWRGRPMAAPPIHPNSIRQTPDLI